MKPTVPIPQHGSPPEKPKRLKTVLVLIGILGGLIAAAKGGYELWGMYDESQREKAASALDLLTQRLDVAAAVVESWDDLNLERPGDRENLTAAEDLHRSAESALKLGEYRRCRSLAKDGLAATESLLGQAERVAMARDYADLKEELAALEGEADGKGDYLNSYPDQNSTQVWRHLVEARHHLMEARQELGQRNLTAANDSIDLARQGLDHVPGTMVSANYQAPRMPQPSAGWAWAILGALGLAVSVTLAVVALRSKRGGDRQPPSG